jgi:hypothetical protein
MNMESLHEDENIFPREEDTVSMMLINIIAQQIIAMRSSQETLHYRLKSEFMKEVHPIECIKQEDYHLIDNH